MQEYWEQFANRIDNCGYHCRQNSNNVFQNGHHIVFHSTEGIHHVLGEVQHIRVRIAKTSYEGINGCLHKTDGTRDGLGCLSFEVTCILLGLFQEICHGYLCLFSIGHGGPGLVIALRHGIGFQGGVVHGNTKVVHHGVVALCRTGHSLQSRFGFNTHNGCHIGGSLHGIGGQLQRTLLGDTAALEQRAHFVRGCQVFTLGGSHSAVGFFGNGHQFIGVVTIYGNCTAQVLLQLTKLLNNSTGQFHRGGSCGNYHSTHGGTDTLQNGTQTAELLFRFFGGITGILQFLSHVIGIVGAFLQLTLHVIEGSFRVVQLDLPVLCPAVILPKGFRGIVQRLLEHFYFLLLRVNLGSEGFMPCCQCLRRIIVFAELGLHQLHFGAEDLEGLVNFIQRLFEFLLAFQADFQTKGISHGESPPSSDAIRDDLIDKNLPFGSGNAVVLLMTLPEIQEQTKRHQPGFVPGKTKLADAVIKQSGK